MPVKETFWAEGAEGAIRRNMKSRTVILLALFTVTAVSFGEVEEIRSRDIGGIFRVFNNFDKIVLNSDHELEFTSDSCSYYRKTTEYPVPLGSRKGDPIEGGVFRLKRGEGLVWGCGGYDRNGEFYSVHGGWGSLSYISGKDLSPSIECPKAYREAEYLVHCVFVHTGHGGARVLFDPVRRKQFNLVNPGECDVWFLPYPMKAQDGWEEYVRSVDRLQFRVCEVAKEKLARCSRTDSASQIRLMKFPCEFGVRCLRNYLPDFTEEEAREMGCSDPWGKALLGFPPPVPDENVFTNILVAARRKGDGWQATGVVALSTRYAPRAYLLDDDGRLMMSDAFDVDRDQHRTFYDIPSVRSRENALIVYDGNGQIVPFGQPMKEAFERRKREFDEKRNAAFNWTGEFTLERLLQRVKEDEERIRKAREE